MASGSLPLQQIRQEEWDRRLHEVQVSKQDLNRLIMDYLVIEGYKSAAEEFSSEAHVSPPIDLDSIESRMKIRDSLHSGDVDAAIVGVNNLDSELLDRNPSLFFHLQQQKMIEYIRRGQITEAVMFAQEELAPQGEDSPEFLQELERTMALLAFDTMALLSPSSSATAGPPDSIGELLSPSQRMKTAGEVNAAILESLNQGQEVKLIGLLKLLSWGEHVLGEKANFPRLEPTQME